MRCRRRYLGQDRCHPMPPLSLRLALPYRFSLRPAAASLYLLGAATLVALPSAVHADSPPGSRSAAKNAATSAAAPRSDASPAAPRVLFGGFPLPVSSPDLAPYRDPADGQVCVSPESLAPLGVTYMVDTQLGRVSLAGPDGGAATTSLPVRHRPGTESSADAPAFVPAKAVVEALGGKWEELDHGATCCAFSVLTDVQMMGGQLRVKATLPVLPKVRLDPGRPGLVVLDFPGADIGSLPRALKLDSPNVASARCGQFSDDTARVVLEMKDAPAGPAPGGFVVLGGAPATQLALNPTPPSRIAITAAAPPDAGRPAPGAQAPIVISNNNPSHTLVSAKPSSSKAGKAPAKAAPAPTVIRSVAFRSVSDSEAQVVVQAGRIPDLRTDLSRGRLTVDLVNATLASASVADPLGAAKHPFLREAQLLPRGSAAAQLVLDLTRAVTYTVRMIPGGGFVLDLMLPRSAGGKLKGKLVVIDPGHGRDDSGARGANGAREKDVNLAIATKLANSLRDMGANVILTRADDSFIPVDGRPAIANKAGADFFISIHADSGDYNHSVNGSTIYYHMQIPSCRALAQCIADRLGDMGGIRCKGPHSDAWQYGGRFKNGYGVLRNSQMVAVLCECGYMSNTEDLHRLTDHDMQQKIAGAIANGLKDYVEGNPDFDTRNVQPQAVGTLAPLPDAPLAPDSGNGAGTSGQTQRSDSSSGGGDTPGTPAAATPDSGAADGSSMGGGN